MDIMEMTDSIFTDVEQQTIFSRNYEQIDKLFENANNLLKYNEIYRTIVVLCANQFDSKRRRVGTIS